ncbi:hypothetical protein K440DRAFT_642142 [Wilcoxina mikolae CBS 423.85]|nr:hypothetical protein K440DRAFT_642142 [Wilcoxina mikolae CBS 423.85]
MHPITIPSLFFFSLLFLCFRANQTSSRWGYFLPTFLGTKPHFCSLLLVAAVEESGSRIFFRNGDNDLNTHEHVEEHQGNRDSDDTSDLCSQINDEECQHMATQNHFMLEMILENQFEWKAKQNLEHECLEVEPHK